MSKLEIELVYSSFEPPTIALKVIEEATAQFEDEIIVKEVDAWKNPKRLEELGFYGLLPVSNLLVLVNGSKNHSLAKKIFSLAHKGQTKELVKELKTALSNSR